MMVVIAVLCVPWMLLMKPLYLRRQHKTTEDEVSQRFDGLSLMLLTSLPPTCIPFSPPPPPSYRKDLRFALLTTSFYCCISWWNYSSWINTGFIGRVVIKPLKHLFCGIISSRSMARYMAVKNKEYKLLLNTKLKYTAGVKKCQVHEAKFEINTISFSWGNNYGKPPPDCIGFNTRASLHCQSVCSKLYD